MARHLDAAFTRRRGDYEATTEMIQFLILEGFICVTVVIAFAFLVRAVHHSRPVGLAAARRLPPRSSA